MVSPGGDVLSGVLNPESVHILLGKRSGASEWGSNEWAVPMGKIEKSDFHGQTTMGSSIIFAGNREFSEEIRMVPTRGYDVIAGSFTDKKTGTLVHVVIKQMTEADIESAVKPELPDLREHTEIGFEDIKKIGGLENTNEGVFAVLRMGFEFIIENNRRMMNSGRYRDYLEEKSV